MLSLSVREGLMLWTLPLRCRSVRRSCGVVGACAFSPVCASSLSVWQGLVLLVRVWLRVRLLLLAKVFGDDGVEQRSMSELY